MKDTTAQKLARRKRRIQKRLDPRRKWRCRRRPMFAARAIRYEVADRDRGPFPSFAVKLTRLVSR